MVELERALVFGRATYEHEIAAAAAALREGRNSARGAFRRYEGQSERVWRVFQWQPQRSGTLERAEWPRVHAVVGKYSWR
jgi:hypothetical protein